MTKLGPNKQTLLNQIKRHPALDLQTLVKLVNQYEDLEIEDFRGYVSEALMESLIRLRPKQEQQGKKEIFISYSRKDTEVANLICKALDKANISYFIDRQGIVGGGEFPDILAEAIANCTIFLFLASKSSYASKYTKKEIHFAFNQKPAKILLPYIIDDSTLPKGLQFTFADINIRTLKEHPIDSVLIPDLLQLLGRETQIAEKTRISPSQDKQTDAPEEGFLAPKDYSEGLPETEQEKRDWEALERGNYSALASYKNRYPNSVHMEELDDLMWANTRAIMDWHSLNRYLNDWPMGRHAEEATRALNSFAEWDEVRRSGDLFLIDDYRDSHPDSPFIVEVNSTYYKLRDEKLAEMKKNPSEFSKDDVERLIAADIFTQRQLIDEGLITNESWEMSQIDRDLLPNIFDYQKEDPNIQSPLNSTDVFFFGLTCGGKTCLLMSLAGNNGDGFFIDTTGNSGKYAAALSQFYKVGLTPGSTHGRFCATIHTIINGGKKNHSVNFIEMSGEEFAIRIADSIETSFAKLDTPVCKLLTNNNRKIFFFHFDPIYPVQETEYIEEVKDSKGEVIDERIRKKYLVQETYLSMFLSKLLKPENAHIMQMVDAIHILVPKADVFGERSIREEKAKELIERQYKSLREGIKHCCRKFHIRDIPQIIPFSIGTFYLGDVFKADPTDTLALIDIIRKDIETTKKEPLLTKFVKWFTN